MKGRENPWRTRVGAFVVVIACAFGAVGEGGGGAGVDRKPASEAAMTKTQLPEGGFELGFWTAKHGAAIERLRITAQGDVRIIKGNLSVGGDAAISAPGKGVILRATDGSNCYRITVNDAGVLGTERVPCP